MTAAGSPHPTTPPPEQPVAAPTAVASVWSIGNVSVTWMVHAKHPDTGAWIRRTGIKTRAEAVVEADALCWQLDREAARG